MPPVEVRRFGGISPKVPARDLNRTMAVEAVDVDLSRGSLRPWRTDRLLRTEGAGARTLMLEDCCVQAYAECIDVTEQTLPCRRFYRTGLNGYLEASDDGCNNWCRFGFPCINGAPSMSLLSPRRTEQKVIQRRYLYTLVDRWGNESQGSLPSEPALADWDVQALISGFEVPGAPYCVTRIRIYSTAPTMGSQAAQAPSTEEFFLVAEIPATETSYLHDAASTVYGDLYINEDFDEAPQDLHDIQFWGANQIGGLAGGRLYLSKLDQLHAFPRNSVLAFHDQALRWLATPQFAYVLTCGHPEVVDLMKDCQGGRCRRTTRLPEALPLFGERSVARWGDAVVYASLNGLVLIQGTRYVVLTSEHYTPEQWQALSPQLMVGTVHNGYYFGAGPTGTIRVELPGNLLDRRDNDTVTTLSIRPTAWYRSRDGRLYFADEEGIKEWNAGDGRKPFRWRSAVVDMAGAPKFSAARIDQEQGYGSELTVFAKGRERVRRQVDSACGGFRIPQVSNGCGLQIELSGTAEVFRAKLASGLYELSRT